MLVSVCVDCGNDCGETLVQYCTSPGSLSSVLGTRIMSSAQLATLCVLVHNATMCVCLLSPTVPVVCVGYVGQALLCRIVKQYSPSLFPSVLGLDEPRESYQPWALPLGSSPCAVHFSRNRPWSTHPIHQHSVQQSEFFAHSRLQHTAERESVFQCFTAVRDVSWHNSLRNHISLSLSLPSALWCARH